MSRVERDVAFLKIFAYSLSNAVGGHERALKLLRESMAVLEREQHTATPPLFTDETSTG